MKMRAIVSQIMVKSFKTHAALGIFMLVPSTLLMARYHEVSNGKKLHDLVDTYAYSVVCFAPSSQLNGESLDVTEKKDRKKIFKSLQTVVKAASQQSEYQKYASKDVGFILVDVASRQNSQIKSEYQVSEHNPFCVVFEQGAADMQSKIMRPATPRDIIQLLQQEGGQDLQDLIEDRKQDARLDRQERIASYYAYATAYPYATPYGYYGPYWGGWSPYWRSPYVGWGVYAGGW